MNFKEIQEFEEKLDVHCILFGSLDTHWCLSKDKKSIYWVDGRDDDLYSGYLPEGFTRKEDFLVANIDIQQGTWCTYVFPLEKELTVEEFEERFEEVY